VVSREEHVGRLDVAVDDPAFVGTGEGIHHVPENSDRLADGKLASALDPGAERLPFHHRHSVEEKPIR
jgi:hypothetical protein